MNEMWTDPAERSFMRVFYRGWHPTRLGKWVNRVQGWLAGIGMPPSWQVALEVRGRRSGKTRTTAVVVATVDGAQYLVSMLGPGSEWVKNIEAANGNAVIRHGGRRRVHVVPVPPHDRALVIREYVRIAPSGRQHFPLRAEASLAQFEAIADRYPVYRIDRVHPERTAAP